ncbi:MAG: protease SohB [Legionellales bacterium]|nr:protease SohB [Legionellales bacterium]
MFEQYILFLMKGLTIAFLFVGVLAFFGMIIARIKEQSSSHTEGAISVSNVTDEYDEIRDLLEEETLNSSDLKSLKRERKKEEKLKRKQSSDNDSEKRVFVVNFVGDTEASEVHHMREVITAIVMTAKSQDEVVITLESNGGYVHSYGYAAAQIQRITDKGIPCTICVDTVAASGGYLMACVADKIVAAPFAIVGSIGVIAELPNFNRFLKKYDIDYEQHTAGKYKSTLSMFAENTDEGRSKFKEELAQTHVLFKDFLKENRQNVNVENIATGEYWHARQALSLGLIDTISTSDDYLLNFWKKGHSIYKVSYSEKKTFLDKLSEKFAEASRKLVASVMKSIK